MTGLNWFQANVSDRKRATNTLSLFWGQKHLYLVVLVLPRAQRSSLKSFHVQFPAVKCVHVRNAVRWCSAETFSESVGILQHLHPFFFFSAIKWFAVS